MRAVVCHEFGPVSNLTLEDRPSPSAGPGQVVVEVDACGVNFVDALFVQGQYQIKPPVPFVPGGEVAGAITAVGEDVDGSLAGRRVLVSCGLGGFASELATPAIAAVPIPDSLDAARAATFTQSFCTALFSLRDRAGLRSGESVLVLGGGGGVGLATIAVARRLGARVAAAASSDAKRDAAAAAGAEACFDTSDPAALKSLAREWAGGTGVDVVIDPVGGPLAEPALRALGNGGRFCVIGFASGTIPSLPANQVLLRNRTVVGVDWGAWSMQHPIEQRSLLEELLAWAGEGDLHVSAPTTRPLADVAVALTDLLERRVVGKLALVP
jgi:NADPH2:quinone reductase